jgi:hypothetical protein
MNSKPGLASSAPFAFGTDGKLYVSNFGEMPAAGKLDWRIDMTAGSYDFR